MNRCPLLLTAALVAAFACEGPRVGPPLGGSGGADASGGASGSSGTGALGGAAGALGGADSTGGAGASGGAGSGGGPPACPKDVVRGVCPNAEICTAQGIWEPYSEPRCEACGIVTCPASTPDCCTGFRVLALTAWTFAPKPAAITSFAVTENQVVAEFEFDEAYEIGAIDLLLPEEIPLTSLVVDYTMEGNVYSDFSLERGDGQVGAVYWDGETFDGVVDLSTPVACFPNPSSCPTRYNQLKVRLRPVGPGPARLTVTSITLGTAL